MPQDITQRTDLRKNPGTAAGQASSQVTGGGQVQATVAIEVFREGALIDSLRLRQPSIRIGRIAVAKDGPNDLVLASERVSGLHAQLVVSAHGLTLIDRSRNGTFVNGAQMTAPQTVGADDRIDIDVFTLYCCRAQTEPQVIAPQVVAPMNTEAQPPLDPVNPINDRRDDRRDARRDARGPEAPQGLADLNLDDLAPAEAGPPDLAGLLGELPDELPGELPGELPAANPAALPGSPSAPKPRPPTIPLPTIPLPTTAGSGGASAPSAPPSPFGVPLRRENFALEGPSSPGDPSEAAGQEAAGGIGEIAAGAPQSPLAALYRELAAGLGGAAWGRPPGLTAAAVPQVLHRIRQRLATTGGSESNFKFKKVNVEIDHDRDRDRDREKTDPTVDPRWEEWLARELCGVDPIHALLGDTAVDGLVVRGDRGITVLRGDTREAATRRFSCVEAVVAAVERWTGQRLRDTTPVAACRDGLTIHAFAPGLVAEGPLVIVRRAREARLTLAELVAEERLSPAAADLLRDALAEGCRLLVASASPVDPSALLRALASELSEPTGTSPGQAQEKLREREREREREKEKEKEKEKPLVAVIQRSSTWSSDQALVIDGHRPAAAIAACVAHLRPDWLIVEELAGDELGALGRRRGGLLAATVATSGAAALARLAAGRAAAAGGELAATRRALAADFDLVIDLEPRRRGGAQVRRIAELRGTGELAELFSREPATAGLAATGVDSHRFAGRGR